MAVDLIPTVHGMTELHGMIAKQQGLERLLFFVSPQVFAIKELRKELGDDHPAIVRYHEIQAAAIESLNARSFAD
jgi:hypothetical protein